MADRATALGEWKRHWPLAFVSTAGLTFSPIAVYSLGLVMEPLQQEFGWSRGDISSGMIVVSIFAILFSSPVGAVIDRFGARRVALPGMLAGMFAIAALSLASGALWQWMALWVFYAIAALFIKTTLWCTAVSKAFFASRGLALGVVLCGTAISQTLTPKIAQLLIDNLRLAFGLPDPRAWLGRAAAGPVDPVLSRCAGRSSGRAAGRRNYARRRYPGAARLQLSPKRCARGRSSRSSPPERSVRSSASASPFTLSRSWSRQG